MIGVTALLVAVLNGPIWVSGIGSLSVTVAERGAATGK